MITVLLLDDDHDFFASIRQHLARVCDITVHSVTSAGRALTAIRQKVPDVVVTGFWGTTREGPALIRKLQKMVPAIPVVVITGKPGGENESATRHPMIARCLERPEKPDACFYLELAEAIRIAVMENPKSKDPRYEQNLLAQIMETSMVGILVVDQEGVVTFSNRAAEELLGSGPNGAGPGGKPLSAFPFAALIAAGSPIRGQHYTIGEGARERVFLVNGAPLQTEPGEKQQMVLVVEEVTETVHLEEVLIRNEDRFRAILEEQNELICRFLPDTTFTYVNEAYCRYNRRSADQLLGQKLTTLFPQEEMVQISALLEQIKEGVPYVTCEHLHRGEGQEEQWQQWAVRGIRNEEGAVIEYQSVGRDVTAQKRMEQALRESEERYRLIADTMEDLVWMMGPDHEILFISPSMERALGYSFEELQGRPLERYLTRESRILVEKAARREHEGEQGAVGPGTLDLEFRRKNGSTARSEVQLTVIGGGEGHPTGVLGVGRDATARRRAELALRESEERFRLLAENATDMIARHSLAGAFWYVSPVCMPLLGYTSEQLISRSSFEFIHPDDLGIVQQAYTDVLTTPDVVRACYRFRRIDGTYIWFETIGRAIWDPVTGLPIEIHTSSREITDRKRLEEAITVQNEELQRYSTALAQANRKLNLLNSVTRHDILNQLTVISGYLEILQNDITDPVLIGYLRRQQRAAELIQHQIEFTKAYQNLGAEAPRWQKASEVLAAAVVSLDLGGVTLDADLDGLEIFADLLLERVFFNLVENGIRHGEDVTRIKLWYVETDREVVLAYQDDGIGIPVAQKEQIFERGYGSNTGLGLFLIREILSITGIGIREIGEEGEGARFLITIPAGDYRIRRAEEEGC
ncbi:PAS domain S-box protein [Methanosphaerula subterraneus]|uniref:PAS domain-containing protein n=1 Tax=Methanosphaerula subterraneus TaxID=3350244 RepID=UPI003F82449A